MNEKLRQIKDIALETAKRNEETIVGLLGTIVLGVFCTKMNIPFTVGRNNQATVGRQKDDIPEFDGFFYPRNSTEAAVLSTMKSAEKMSFDSGKVDAARNIKRIVSGKDLDDDTRSFAVMALSRIMDSMTFDSNRNLVTDMIVNITKG